MNRKLLTVCVGLGIGAIGFVAMARGADAMVPPEPPKPKDAKLWLSPEEISAIVAQEPAPPAPGSEADKADLQAELDAQTNRTPDKIAEAKADQHFSPALFYTVTGVQITKEKDPVTYLFIERLNWETMDVMSQSKEKFKRLRPYLAHKEIHALFEVKGFSYPSGHSLGSYTNAIILGQLFPDKAQALLDKAHLIAQSRVDAGVHYPTDIGEGKAVGEEVAKELLAKPDFQAELAAAKAELAK